MAESKTGWDYEVLVASALLHDIGIKPAEKLHGYNNGTVQEQCGSPEAQRLLAAMEFPEAKTAKAMQIIGNHCPSVAPIQWPGAFHLLQAPDKSSVYHIVQKND